MQISPIELDITVVKLGQARDSLRTKSSYKAESGEISAAQWVSVGQFRIVRNIGCK